MQAARHIISQVPAALHCLSRVLEKRDEITHGHANRVGLLTYKLARQMGLPAPQCETIGQAALMHDIGKLVVPLEIIQKPSGITAEEWGIVKTHCVHGHTILTGTDDRELNLAAEIALAHHEHYDGTGYPHGLRGQEIPLPARLTMICDIYDALRQSRPYRHGLSHQQTMSIIVVGDGKTRPEHFDPAIHAAFQKIADDFSVLYDEPEARTASASA